ncbi:MAG TPA: glycosyltransferase, partial [Candidatus Manganitrophaceae bacterium]
MMKILLIGDYPPPYGGISVHVQQLARFLTQNGAVCRVIDIEPGSAPKEGAIRVKGGVDFLRRLAAFSAKGYEAHIHTNGHNFKSWAAIGATAWVGFVFNRRNIATLHSGHTPAYLSAAGAWRRRLIRLFLRPLGKVIAVSEKIEKALLELKVDSRRISVLPAFSLGDRSEAIPERARIWREKFKPLIVSAVYLEEEYGVSFLIEACGALQKIYPDLGCIIMGSGSQEGSLRREIQKRGGEG